MVSKSKNLGFFGDSRNVAVSNPQLRAFKRKEGGCWGEKGSAGQKPTLGGAGDTGELINSTTNKLNPPFYLNINFLIHNSTIKPIDNTLLTSHV